MKAHKIETKLLENGSLTLQNLPFQVITKSYLTVALGTGIYLWVEMLNLSPVPNAPFPWFVRNEHFPPLTKKSHSVIISK